MFSELQLNSKILDIISTAKHITYPALLYINSVIAGTGTGGRYLQVPPICNVQQQPGRVVDITDGQRDWLEQPPSLSDGHKT